MPLVSAFPASRSSSDWRCRVHLEMLWLDLILSYSRNCNNLDDLILRQYRDQNRAAINAEKKKKLSTRKRKAMNLVSATRWSVPGGVPIVAVAWARPDRPGQWIIMDGRQESQWCACRRRRRHMIGVL